MQHINCKGHSATHEFKLNKHSSNELFVIICSVFSENTTSHCFTATIIITIKKRLPMHVLKICKLQNNHNIVLGSGERRGERLFRCSLPLGHFSETFSRYFPTRSFLFGRGEVIIFPRDFFQGRLFSITVFLTVLVAIILLAVSCRRLCFHNYFFLDSKKKEKYKLRN